MESMENLDRSSIDQPEERAVDSMDESEIANQAGRIALERNIAELKDAMAEATAEESAHIQAQIDTLKSQLGK